MPARLIISLIIFETLLVFVHLAVYETLAAAFGIGGFWLALVFILLAFSFVIMTILTQFYYNVVLRWLYNAAAYWFGLVHFLFFGAVGYFVTARIIYSFNIYALPWMIGTIWFGAGFLLHLYGTLKSGRGEITKITVELPNIPPSWKGRTIAFISDIHLGNVRQEAFAARITRKINALKPYAVFIGGDLFDGSVCDEKKIIEPFRGLNTPAGTFFIAGNHEYHLKKPQAAFDAIKSIGVRILNNEYVDLDGVMVMGVDYEAVKKPEDLQRILNGFAIKKDAPSILLKHEPSNLDIVVGSGASVGFFGHTHQGQIFPLSLLTKQIYKGYDYGLKTNGATKIYTSSGVGTWGPPLRLGTKSEIVLATFV